MTTKGEVLIRVDDLHKVFDDSLHALNGITTEIRSGEVVVIVGPSGSGKSTFLRSLNLLEVPTSGHVYFEGVDITDKKVDINKHRQKMGMVFQHFNLFPHKTILQNITLAPIKLLKKDPKEAQDRARELLRMVGLEEKADSYPSQLSGGQKQRLCIARALMKDSDLYIFDDSFSALDFKTDKALRDALKEETKEAAVVIIAQRISTILHASQIVVLDEGEIAGVGTHEYLMENCAVYRDIARSQMKGGE